MHLASCSTSDKKPSLLVCDWCINGSSIFASHFSLFPFSSCILCLSCEIVHKCLFVCFVLTLRFASWCCSLYRSFSLLDFASFIRFFIALLLSINCQVSVVIHSVCFLLLGPSQAGFTFYLFPFGAHLICIEMDVIFDIFVTVVCWIRGVLTCLPFILILMSLLLTGFH